VIRIHAKGVILLIVFEGPLEHQVKTGIKLLIGKTNKVKITVGLLHHYAFCLVSETTHSAA